MLLRMSLSNIHAWKKNRGHLSSGEKDEDQKEQTDIHTMPGVKCWRLLIRGGRSALAALRASESKCCWTNTSVTSKAPREHWDAILEITGRLSQTGCWDFTKPVGELDWEFKPGAAEFTTSSKTNLDIKQAE